jgi:hypothetical protein
MDMVTAKYDLEICVGISHFSFYPGTARLLDAIIIRLVAPVCNGHFHKIYDFYNFYKM